MGQLLGLASLLCGLWFLAGMPIVVVVLARKYRRAAQSKTAFLVAAAMLVAFYTSAAVIWKLGTADWSLSFLTTLDASVNAAKYGHPVEHRAEVRIVWLLLASTLVAATVGIFTALVRRPRSGRRLPAG